MNIFSNEERDDDGDGLDEPLFIPHGAALDSVGYPLTHPEAIKALIAIVDQVPQVEIPVRHTFQPWGEYWREITMPAGITGVGHIHKHRHLNIALSGHALVTYGGKTEEIIAPAIFYSEPGAQKAFQVIEDLRWVTIHENPNGWTEANLVEMEREIFEMPQEMIDAAIPVDEYRMTQRTLCQA